MINNSKMYKLLLIIMILFVLIISASSYFGNEEELDNLIEEKVEYCINSMPDYLELNEVNSNPVKSNSGRSKSILVCLAPECLYLNRQNQTENLKDMEYINGEVISRLEYNNSISVNNLSFHEYELYLRVIPDNFVQKYYARNYTEINPNENIIIGELEYQETTVYHLNIYMNMSNCKTLFEKGAIVHIDN